jgi:hypothetical protein
MYPEDFFLCYGSDAAAEKVYTVIILFFFQEDSGYTTILVEDGTRVKQKSYFVAPFQQFRGYKIRSNAKLL